ncbi:hypothetical protein PsorP6_016775 [Peronosclerospora sorghi]|uniref:Uncharacterized protein n=1 Tax=Peronosclerospora sorghi TaxID=230839 RepID=A0ACC0WD36_9STRA|nr:hypothetical protein PsorP6_016775 [Peronosclerospora sorghi]
MDLSEAAPRLEELILSGADLTALNHTSLSLWHFQQLLLDLLPSAETNEREEDQDDVKSLESPEAVATDTPWSGVKLNEGMNVAAALYEHPMNVLKAAIGSQEQTGETLSGTEGVSLQGVTASIKGRMTPDTKVSALFHRFRCVICLDVSPSVLSIDPSSGRLFLDLMYESVELFIWSLLRPMVVGREIFTPELHVSVLVQGALVESLCVVLQGYIVTSTNAASFLQLIKDRFQLIENDWASQAQEQGPGFFFGNASPASLDWILQNAVFALNSLPSDCAPMIIFVTDGVVDVKNFHSYDNLLMQLVRHDIQCHFLHIGGGEYSELNATFGLVPDTNLLRFVATCTGGTIFDYYALHEACYGTTRVSSDRVKKMTCLQESLFLRKSSVHAKSVPIVRLDEIDKTSFDERTLLPLRPYRMWREKVHEYRIFADVNRIVEARLCEGFIINKIRVKTYQPPHLIKRASVQAGIDPISSGGASASSNSGHHDDITKILIVFLLQWKQNVWLEYVISTTTETYAASQSLANAILHTGRRASEHSVKSLRTATAVKAAGTFYCDDQGITWSEWHIKMNILGYADFLRVFEDTMQCSSENRERGAMKEGNTMMASAAFVHDFILNVQDVDRVLLHLMTATASMSETSESVASQYSFGTNSTPAGATPKITSSHPVFNIIGDLSTVLWHRWFFVERFELLAVVKSDACMDLFYRSETHDETHRDSLFSNWSGAGALSQGICHAHDATYGPSNGLNSFGIQNVAETLVAILVKWSSQQLSKTLFLKFLHPNFSVERGHTAPRSIASSSSITCSGGMTHRRRQRTHISIDECANESNGRKSKAALCFVRLEFNNKTLCAVHVAFFATKLSTRREVLNDLKGTIFAGINELAVTSNLSKLLSSSMVETPVILCHRLMSRLLVTHDTLLLEEAGPLDSYANSPAVEAEKSARVNPVSSSCCAGSKLQQHRVFGAYVWHSSWKWKLSNLAALLDAMRRLHCIRISCGFWVLDWKMKEDEAQVESIVFGREIILESENGHVKTALVQYVLRRVSDTCLMTSFWIEPKHGSIKTRLPKQDAKNLKFHWSQRQAIGHCTPLEYYESSRACQSTTVEEGELHENEDCTYLDEGELLHLIGSYIFKSDRHLFSCLNTFDCIIHLRETMESSSQLNKDSRGTVGSNWSLDRQLAAEQGMILPPFSTARLLATSKRSTEHYLMYLQSGRSFVGGVKESKIDAPSVSPANENLYSMLGLTLRGLSDCEVSWTDYYGDVVADSDSLSSRNASDEEGLNGQLPLWLKHHLAVTFKDRVPHHTLSKGKCFAKVVGDDCVVLAFFPSLDTLQVQTKKSSTGDSLKSNDEMESNPPFDKFEMAAGKESKVHTPSQQFSVRSAQEDGSTSRGVRMSVSADDIVLYQERRRGFREGYKSWRMGHYQGSRDEKQSYGQSESEQHHANVEEDAEFNKDVAVATSSLSVPFFLKFECRVLNGSRETRSNSDDSFPRRRTSTDTMLLSRSSSSSMHDDLSTKLVADSHPSSPESRQEEFKMFLESLKTSQGSQVHSTPTDGSHITESLLKMPSGRIALRLVTLTLPNERVFDDGHVPPHAPFVMDNGGSKMAGLPSISHNFSTLHHFQRQVLTHIRKDIKEWSSVEILSILKSADEITPAVGALVQRLFNDLPELAVTKVKYPLEFVAGSHETSVDPLDLFKRELEKGDLLHVHRCNDVYFVVDIQNLSHVDGSGAIEIDVNLRIPYWAFLEVRADHISLQFHHSDHLGVTARGFNRLEILTRLQLGIRAVCRRVNQFLLLLHLHETRTCNGLLLPPNENFPTSPRSPKPRAISQDMSVHPDRFFWPGQFECDLRYSAFFNLHERLAPNFALNMLCTSALEQFQVHNRRHIFVYRQRNGQVFYMKIGIFYESKDASKQSMGDRREISGLNKSNTGGSTANATTMTTPVCGIRLEVFGVSQPGEEITHELCRLLERKLDEATQVVLMKLLARNTKFQLSHSDLTFLCPPATEPSSTIQYVFPTETVDCCKLLSYLSQTLKLAPYIRPVTTSGSLNPSRNVRESANNSLRLTRRGSVASVGSFISFQGEDTAPEQTAAVKCEEDTEGKRSAHIHPAYFGRYSKTFEFPEDNAIISFDPATRSPVFFTERKMEGEVNVVTDTAPAARLVCLPEVLAQASYVLNLNPDLRLAQEFLSRVGKGLAFMRVDFIRETSESKLRQGDDLGSSKRAKQMRDIPGLAELFPVPVNTNATTLMARCQVWIRGSIDTTELSQVVEAFVDEALYDYHIEESIKKLRCSNQCPDASPSYETSPHLSGTPINLPSEVETLMSLFKNACLLPSSSVTNIRVNVSIAPWNIHNVLTQLQSFLSCLPHHLRPAVFAKSKFSDCYEIVSSPNDRTHSNCNTSSDKFRLVVQYTEDREAFDGADSSDSDAETTASISSAIHHIDPLMRTDSTHSEASDNDSVVPLTWASTSAGSDALAVSQLQNLPPVPCTTSSTVGLMGGGLVHAPPRQKGPSLSERAVFLHSKNDNTHAHHSHLQGQDHRDVKRSFYYVVDLSTRKGLRLYGYNMSIGFTESFATHIARVFTWSMLREKLLRSLLLEKSGLSAAAPRGSIVLQPSSLFFNGGKSEQTGKHVGKHCAVVCKDSSVHFIAYCPPVLSILESNKHFPRVLDAGFLSSIEGTSLGIYLREAQTQPAIAVTTSQYQRPRGKSNTNLGVPIGPPSIPELARDFSGPSLSQRSFHSNGDAPSNVLGPTSGRTKSGGIHSNTNMSDSMASSPGKRANGPNSALPFPGGSRGDTVNRMRGGAGAATALMAARERARGGGGFSNRMGTGPLPRAVAGSSSYDSVAPWDLPLPKKKGPRLQTAADDGGPHDARMNPSAVDDAVPTNSRHLVSKNKVSAVDSSLQRGPPAFGRVGVGSLSSASSLSGLTLAKLAMQRRSSNESECLDPGHIHSSWKKRLETSWGPRFMYPGKTERWSIERKKSHELEVGDDRGKCMKSVSPVSFFCGAFEKRWEAFEARSTNHMVGKNLLEKLSSLGAEEELDEPVAKDVVAHLMESGHFVLFQRFRAAFIEGSKPVETINTREDCEHASTRLLALQSCMNLVHLLSYKRKFVFDQEDSWVAKLYSEYTILDMEAGTGADIQGVKQQVVTSLDSLRLKVTSEFYEEYATYLCTLGFRRLATFDATRSHACAFPVESTAATSENNVPGREGFSHYFFCPEKIAAEGSEWKMELREGSASVSVLILEVKCDDRGVRLTAVLTSVHDLEQQDLRFQSHLAPRLGHGRTSGSRLQSVIAWMRRQVQTQSLIYEFTIRYFQQCILQWIKATHELRDRQEGHGSTGGNHIPDVETSEVSSRHPATFQHAVKGLQCFLDAFPTPPVEKTKTPKAVTRKDETVSAKFNDRFSSSALGKTHHRSTSRRFARPRAAARLHRPASLKDTTPLSLLSHDCVLRVATVTLRPTSLQSSCSKVILATILLRYIACHGLRYEVVDLLQFGTPDAVVCHSSSGSFFHRPPSTILPSTQSRNLEPSGGYSLVITTQSLTSKPVEKDSVQLLLLKSTPSQLGVGNGVLPVERALQEAQVFTQELLRVAFQHYERDLLWSRLLFEDSDGPEIDVAHTLALPMDSFRVEVGPQQLEECLRLSICTPLGTLDPRLDELLNVSGVCWQELALRLRDIYSDQLREFEFQEEDKRSSHLLLLCPNTFDLIIHLTFITRVEHTRAEEAQESASGGSKSSSMNESRGSGTSALVYEDYVGKEAQGDMHVEICRREEPTNKQFTFAQRRSIAEFVNSIVHWQWRSLIYD